MGSHTSRKLKGKGPGGVNDTRGLCADEGPKRVSGQTLGCWTPCPGHRAGDKNRPEPDPGPWESADLVPWMRGVETGGFTLERPGRFPFSWPRT